MKSTPTNLTTSPFDWTPDQWADAAAEVSKIVIEASTDWENRRPTPDQDAALIRSLFRGKLPENGIGLEEVFENIRKILPLSGYNGHPRWFGYITSSPNPVGVLADFVASALNQNNNLWRIAPAATSIELQTIDWIKELVGYPEEAEGIFTSGGQFANLVAHTVVRKTRCTWDVRGQGVDARPHGVGKLRFYVSDQAHYCHKQALDLLGLGSDCLAIIPSDSRYRIRIDALEERIALDRAAGASPACVIATAGTVGVGAVDPIQELRELTHRENLWLHVDGAYGAPAVIAASAPESLKAIREADSLALDPHKWLYAPIDAGMTLIRKPGALKEAFGNQVSYLDQRAAENGCLDLVDLTPENSRPFRALKVWLALRAYGLNGYRESIERDLQLARFMASQIEQNPRLSLAAPVETSVVCWVYSPARKEATLDLSSQNELQLRILEEIEKRGIALLSKASLHGGQIALRACFVNFRVTAKDVIETVEATAKIGFEIAGS